MKRLSKIFIIASLLLLVFTLVIISNPNMIPTPEKYLKGRECQTFCWENNFIYSEYLGRNEETNEIVCECSSDNVVFKFQDKNVTEEGV